MRPSSGHIECHFHFVTATTSSTNKGILAENRGVIHPDSTIILMINLREVKLLLLGLTTASEFRSTWHSVFYVSIEEYGHRTEFQNMFSKG